MFVAVWVGVWAGLSTSFLCTCDSKQLVTQMLVLMRAGFLLLAWPKQVVKPQPGLLVRQKEGVALWLWGAGVVSGGMWVP